MNAVAVRPSGAWTEQQRAPEVPPEQLRERALRVLREQWPGLQIWYGNATGTWWAMVADRLVEAPSARELGEYITAVWTRRAW